MNPFLGDPPLRRAIRCLLGDRELLGDRPLNLFRLAWDLLGSEFRGRHGQYEKFYAGRPLSSGSQLPRMPLAVFQRHRRRLLGSYGLPEAYASMMSAGRGRDETPPADGGRSGERADCFGEPPVPLTTTRAALLVAAPTAFFR